MKFRLGMFISFLALLLAACGTPDIPADALTPQGVTGKATFKVFPSHVEGGLVIRGNGVVKNAWNETLALKPGTYTVLGGGYGNDKPYTRQYTAPIQSFTVTANRTTNVTIHMSPINR